MRGGRAANLFCGMLLGSYRLSRRRGCSCPLAIYEGLWCASRGVADDYVARHLSDRGRMQYLDLWEMGRRLSDRLLGVSHAK